MFKVYDEVWIMENNKPAKFRIFSNTQYMNPKIDDTIDWSIFTKYMLIEERYIPNEHHAFIVPIEKIFATKEELIASL